MRRGIFLPLIMYAVSHVPSVAFAVDPFTAAAAVSTVASAISSMSETAGEVASLGGAFSDLYSEVDSDARVDESARRLMNEVNEIKRYADELGYTEQELESLTSDQYSAENLRKLTDSLRNLTRAVRAGKRAIRLVTSLKSKAEASQVESARTQAESLATLYLILEQEQRRNLEAAKKELKDRVDRIDLYLSMERDMAANGAKYFKGTRILAAFPRMEIVQKAIEFSKRYLGPLALIMFIIFSMRVIVGALGLDSADSVVQAKKDLILCAVVLVTYTVLLRLVFDASATLAHATEFGEFQALKDGLPKGPGSVWSALHTDYKVLLAIGFEAIKWLCYTTIQFIVNWVLAFMVGILPLIAVLAIMTGHRGALTAYLVGVFALSLWAVFWNFGGYIAGQLWTTTINPAASVHALKAIIYSTVATLAQLISPFAAVAALKIGGASPVTSIGGLAIKGGAAKVTAGTSVVASQGAGFLSGVARTEGGGSSFGKVLGYGVNQSLGRLTNGVASGAAAAKGQGGKGFVKGFARGAVYHDSSGKGTSEVRGSRVGRLADSFKRVKPAEEEGPGTRTPDGTGARNVRFSGRVKPIELVNPGAENEPG